MMSELGLCEEQASGRASLRDGQDEVYDSNFTVAELLTSEAFQKAKIRGRNGITSRGLLVFP